MDRNSLNLERGLNLKKLLLRVLTYWYLIAIALVVTSTVVFFVFKSSSPKYLVGSSLLILDQEAGARGGASALPEIMLGPKSNFDNQVLILTSHKQIEKALELLDFSVSYYEKDFLRKIEIYKSSPFKIVLDTTSTALRNLDFEIEFVSDSEFNLTCGAQNYSAKHKFYEKIKHERFAFSVVPVAERIANSDYKNKIYFFSIHTLDKLVNKYKRGVFARKKQMNASILAITMEDNSVRKGIDFLNALGTISVNYTLERKNQIANNTINFIDRQLVGVIDSLSAAQRVLEDFRSSNELMDVSMQGQMIIQQSQDLEAQRIELSGRLDYLKYLYNYIQDNRNVMDVMSPLSMGVSDPVLSQLISDFSGVYAEKSSLQFNSREDNPNIIRLDHRLNSMRNTILENAKSAIESSTQKLQELNGRIMRLSSEIRKLPQTEQALVGIERRFKMSDQMYTYLLEKRSDAQLAKASNMPDNEIVEDAIYLGQTAPDTTRLLLIVVVFGLVLPFSGLFLFVFLNDKVLDQDDLEQISNLSVLGSLPEIQTLDSPQFISQNPKSVFTEALRGIRTKMEFYHHIKNQKTILISSSLPNEGKTFTAISLAKIFAMLDKKTLIIDLDLRKVSSTKRLGLDEKTLGISNYLANPTEVNLADIIYRVEGYGFDLMAGGHIPPNPMELISRPAMQELMTQLKGMYDVIIADTPPLGLVSDAHLLFNYSDVNVIVVRYGVTPKTILKKVLEDSQVSKLNNLSIVLNAIPISEKSFNYQYAYAKDYYNEGK